MSTIKITYKKSNAVERPVPKFDLNRRVRITSKGWTGYVVAYFFKPDGVWYNVELVGMPTRQIKESDLSYA